MPLFDIAQHITSSENTTMNSGMKSVGTAGTLLKGDSEDTFLFMDIEDTDSDSDEDSSDDESEDDSDDDDDDSDEEVEAAEQMLKELQTMRQARTFGSMGDLRGKPQADVKNVFAERSAQRVQNNGTSIPKIFSAADLQQLMTHFNPEQQTCKQPITRSKTSVLELSSIGHIGQATSAQKMVVDDDAVNPDKHLAKLLGGNPTFFSHDDDALEGFFLPNSAEFKKAWVQELTRAVRDQDMPTLEQMHRTGQNLQACNAFGESVIHLAVRRGSPDALRFLLQEAGISMRVRCDLGRSPVHDAAWCLASNPKSYQMMALLLNESPMQLLIKDKRGYTPLQYVPRVKWAECNDFLDRQCKKGRFSSLMMTN